MILPANDVSDFQIDIVGAGRQVIGGHAVAAEESEVFDIGGKFALRAVDFVVKLNFLGGVALDFEADDERLARGGAFVALLLGEGAHFWIEDQGPSPWGLSFGSTSAAAAGTKSR